MTWTVGFYFPFTDRNALMNPSKSGCCYCIHCRRRRGIVLRGGCWYYLRRRKEKRWRRWRWWSTMVWGQSSAWLYPIRLLTFVWLDYSFFYLFYSISLIVHFNFVFFFIFYIFYIFFYSSIALLYYYNRLKFMKIVNIIISIISIMKRTMIVPDANQGPSRTYWHGGSRHEKAWTPNLTWFSRSARFPTHFLWFSRDENQRFDSLVAVEPSALAPSPFIRWTQKSGEENQWIKSVQNQGLLFS